MATNQEVETAVLQRQAARLVEREVYCCMSSLVFALVGGNHDCSGAVNVGKPLADLMEQAMELACSIPDYEGAAREAGWSEDDEDGAESFCATEGVDPHEMEVYEHWAISSWLADKLADKGERVDRDFAGLIVWARTTTGQAISIDHVIETIVRETGYAAHAA